MTVHPQWVKSRRSRGGVIGQRFGHRGQVIMPKTIQVRDVPDDVHERLRIRAAEERRSLSEFVRAEIVEIARRPTMAEMLQRLAARPVTEVPESSAEALADERLGN